MSYHLVNVNAGNYELEVLNIIDLEWNQSSVTLFSREPDL